MSKRIVFNPATPNDQGGIIPSEVIDFSRYDKNPVILKNHNWNADPIGIMTDIKLIGGNWTGIPVFHRITQESKDTADMYDQGFIKACSIGGFSEWKTNSAGQAQIDKNGNRTCAHFDLYEISICTLPSNEDAVTLSADQQADLSVKIYQKDEIDNVSTSITTLSSKFKFNNVEKQPNQQNAENEISAKLEAAEKEVTRLKAEKDAAEKQTLQAGGASEVPDALPGVMKQVLSFTGEILKLFGVGKVEPAKTENTSLPAGSKGDPTVKAEDPLTTKVGDGGKITLKSKKDQAKKKMDDAKDAAEKAVEAAKKAKEKADKEDASKEEKDAYKSAIEKAENAVKEAEEMEATYNSMDDDDDDAEEASTKNAAKPERTTNSAKPVMKNVTEIREQLKLAATPADHARVNSQLSRGLTFSRLHAAWKKDEYSEEGRVFSRVLAQTGDQKDVNDHAIMLNAIINDPKYEAIVKKVRFNQNIQPRQMQAMVQDVNARGGVNLTQLAAKLNSGQVSYLCADNTLKERTMLTSTDTLLASPDLYAVEWLPLAIFAMYPSDAWKSDISIFGAQMTSENTGLIWTNVAADPTITKGAQPNNPTPYTYSDNAVSLALASYWLNPMLWQPIDMHQLRTDKMATGWAQAFNKWGAIIDDNLIYTIASLIPAASIINSSGAVTAIGSGPNKFYYNNTYSGNLKGAAYDDVFVVEQVFNNQNYNLDLEGPTLVLDPILERTLKQDPNVISLLSRFISTDDAKVLKIGNTKVRSRSRVAIYDPATTAYKDPNSTIPSTATSAGIGFIPSQLGIGLGALDVFMQQSPGNYGYIMSADCRVGINALRANFNGLAGYNYGS